MKFFRVFSHFLFFSIFNILMIRPRKSLKLPCSGFHPRTRRPLGSALVFLATASRDRDSLSAAACHRSPHAAGGRLRPSNPLPPLRVGCPTQGWARRLGFGSRALVASSGRRGAGPWSRPQRVPQQSLLFQ
jgi:hypothetical protein